MNCEMPCGFDNLSFNSDNYINATELFDSMNKSFLFWKTKTSSISLISNLYKSLNEFPIKQTPNNCNQTIFWIHPSLFESILTEYSIYFQNSANISENCHKNKTKNMFDTFSYSKHSLQPHSKLTNVLLTTIKNLNKKTLHLESQLSQKSKSYTKLLSHHQKLLYKRSHHKFEKGNCFYLWHDKDLSSKDPLLIKYKFGISNNINTRLQTERTICPNIHLDFLLFVQNPKILESAIKTKFESNLVWMNHEYIHNIQIDNFIKWILQIIPIIYTEFKIQDINAYNNFN